MSATVHGQESMFADGVHFSSMVGTTLFGGHTSGIPQMDGPPQRPNAQAFSAKWVCIMEENWRSKRLDVDTSIYYLIKLCMELDKLITHSRWSENGQIGDKHWEKMRGSKVVQWVVLKDKLGAMLCLLHPPSWFDKGLFGWVGKFVQTKKIKYSRRWQQRSKHTLKDSAITYTGLDKEWASTAMG